MAADIVEMLRHGPIQPNGYSIAADEIIRLRSEAAKQRSKAANLHKIVEWVVQCSGFDCASLPAGFREYLHNEGIWMPDDINHCPHTHTERDYNGV